MLMVGRRRRRRASINITLDQCLSQRLWYYLKQSSSARNVVCRLEIILCDDSRGKTSNLCGDFLSVGLSKNVLPVLLSRQEMVICSWWPDASDRLIKDAVSSVCRETSHFQRLLCFVGQEQGYVISSNMAYVLQIWEKGCPRFAGISLSCRWACNTISKKMGWALIWGHIDRDW